MNQLLLKSLGCVCEIITVHVCVFDCMGVYVFEHKISDEKCAHVCYGEEEQAECVLVLTHL